MTTRLHLLLLLADAPDYVRVNQLPLRASLGAKDKEMTFHSHQLVQLLMSPRAVSRLHRLPELCPVTAHHHLTPVRMTSSVNLRSLLLRLLSSGTLSSLTDVQMTRIWPSIRLLPEIGLTGFPVARRIRKRPEHAN